jgi:hypothetical protein
MVGLAENGNLVLARRPTTTRHGQGPAAVMPATFQNIDKTFQIGVGIDVRNNACLRREMDHLGKAVPSEYAFHCGAIGEIDPFECKTPLTAQDVQPGLLQSGS